jgi:DNA-binding Xre family transcriptional regulator
MVVRRIKRYWKEGTYMHMRSPDTFKAFMALRNVTVRDLAERIAGALRCRVEDLYEISNDKDRTYFEDVAA